MIISEIGISQENLAPLPSENNPAMPDVPPGITESKRSYLRVFVILMAVLVLAGGIVYIASNKINKSGSWPKDKIIEIFCASPCESSPTLSSKLIRHSLTSFLTRGSFQ